MRTDRIYSCDDHLDLWALPPDLWQERLPATLRERGPKVVDSSVGGWWMADGGTPLGPSGNRMMGDYSAITRAGIEDDGYRASNPRLRLEDMDRDGVWASVIYGPSLFGLPIGDPELKAACLRTYNDWAADFNGHAPDRLCVLPVLPVHDVAAAVAELERVARMGHRGAIVYVFEMKVTDRKWEPLWAAAAASGLPISFHIGSGTSMLGPVPESWEMAAFSTVCPKQLDEPLCAMVFSGALDRNPGMKLVLAEAGIGWIPYLVARMDLAWEKHGPRAKDVKLSRKPSEIFHRQVIATFEEEPLGPQLIPLVGADNFMWASDYPHPDSTFPHSRDAIAQAFAGLPDEIVRKATVENCARLYRFA